MEDEPTDTTKVLAFENSRGEKIQVRECKNGVNLVREDGRTQTITARAFDKLVTGDATIALETDGPQRVFDPDVPEDKYTPLSETVTRLLQMSSDRLGEYEDVRSGVHWRNDDAYRHVEKSYGELANLYWLLRNDASDDEIYREAADALNHILMALDIGSEDHTSSLETH